jgi:hypothetical protein
MISAALNVERYDVEAKVLVVLLKQPLGHLGCKLVVVVVDGLDRLAK